MTAKRIILMYISEVSGHRTAALAIGKAIKTVAPETELLSINAFHYTNPASEKIINRIYMGVINRAPRIWDYLYDNPRIVKTIEGIKQAIHKVNSPKLKSLFDEFKPDTVVCTQAFPCGMVADYKKIYSQQIPLIAVLTDYVPHSYWIYDNINYYVTPSQEVAMRLHQKGVPLEKIRSLGIPFDIKFNEPVDTERVRKKLGLEAHIPTILIMGGGQGLGPIKMIIKSLELIRKDFQEIVVCGSNTKLYEALQQKIKNYKKKIVLFGYADNVHELMSISNLIITKPGGITTAEALTKKLPMIIVKPIPGQEISNTNYLIEKQAAVKVDRSEEVNLVVEDLLSNAQKALSFSETAARIAKPNASIDIAKLALEQAQIFAGSRREAISSA